MVCRVEFVVLSHTLLGWCASNRRPHACTSGDHGPRGQLTLRSVLLSALVARHTRPARLAQTAGEKANINYEQPTALLGLLYLSESALRLLDNFYRSTFGTGQVTDKFPTFL